MKPNHYLLVLAMCVMSGMASAQLPVEGFAGTHYTSVDVQFFKWFDNGEGKPTRWLFFNRNRAVSSYQPTRTPLFGFTEAVSYNAPALKGLAPVTLVQVLSTGVYAKSGVQYARNRPSFTLFAWLVGTWKGEAGIDGFLLLRYTPQSGRLRKLFMQAESVNTLPFGASGVRQFTQRARVGMRAGSYQFGIGVDATQSRGFAPSHQNGLFIRNEF